ncbi:MULTISPECIES: helix-turn-helix domain-containing protein [unclassified Roseivivax]|uniref:winged helix-turn-helix transcriptional regulator n=1 Tax=unclassified Roseivivax TaxID=2639302 RepID=UPI0020C7D6D4|nr:MULTISPECIES: helix-turn-helix domain-containing protein [unclassified Roseivivax]
MLSRVGNKWAALLILVMSERPKRFNDLRREVESISQRMLTQTLRGLERDGLVSRTVVPTTPPQVTYALTPLGETLIEPLYALCLWSAENVDAVEAHQRDFDARGGPA